MFNTWATLAVYVGLAWFAICTRRAATQIVARNKMIELINKNRLVSGEEEFVQYPSISFVYFIVSTLRLFFGYRTI